jgi:hypothetical protein
MPLTTHNYTADIVQRNEKRVLILLCFPDAASVVIVKHSASFMCSFDYCLVVCTLVRAYV